MNPYFVVADLMLACGFIGVAALGGYRILKQGAEEPELQHLLPVMLASILAAFGCLTRNIWPCLGLFAGVGMFAVVIALGRAIRVMIAQPTMADILAVVAKVDEVQSKVDDLIDYVSDESLKR